MHDPYAFDMLDMKLKMRLEFGTAVAVRNPRSLSKPSGLTEGGPPVIDPKARFWAARDRAQQAAELAAAAWCREFWVRPSFVVMWRMVRWTFVASWREHAR